MNKVGGEDDPQVDRIGPMMEQGGDFIYTYYYDMKLCGWVQCRHLKPPSDDAIS